MSVSKEEFIRCYTEAIREGNAAVFGGSGLSRPSGFVDWKGLLAPLASDIKLDINKEHDLLSVAQYYRNKRRTRGGINKAIMDAFSKDASINENIEILTRLPIFTYWTTNYDEMIEKGIQDANRNPDVKSESDQLSNMKRDRDAIVYKMHGDVNRPSMAVLTKEDYELYDYRRPLFRTALKGDLVSKVFLFIGFSFEDPNLSYILGQIHSLLGENVPDHYCFFRRVQPEDYSNEADFAYDMAKQDMQEENLRNYGIQTVFVDSYDEITHILRDVESAFKTNKVFISGSAIEFADPWDEQKAKKLAETIAEELVHADCRVFSGFGLGIGSSVVNGALRVIYNEKYRHVDEHLCLRPFPQNIIDSDERKRVWRKYREGILEETGVAIFMFGNKKDLITGSVIEADGCIQEFELASEKNATIIPIGSTGYAARTIFDKVKNDPTKYQYLLPYLDVLESETDVKKIVETVMKIIENRMCWR